MQNSEKTEIEKNQISAQDTEFTFKVTQVVAEPLRFKAKLAIGEDAYKILKAKKYMLEALDAAGGATTGASVAQSAAIASTFFAPKGIVGLLGIGAAATPLSWVIAAGVVGAGITIAVNRKFRSRSDAVSVIPHFINTPLDLLATALFNMMATLGFKIVEIDGTVKEVELEKIQSYFVKEWGYDAEFVQQALTVIQSEASKYSIKEISEKLAAYKKANPDCNFKAMAEELISFLKAVSEADGVIDEREEMAIERVQAIFKEVDEISLKKVLNSGVKVATNTSAKTAEIASVLSVSTKNKISESLGKVNKWYSKVKSRRN